MNSNMLGLQRRPMNISARVDGRQSGSKNSGISESPEETPVSMRAGLPTSSSSRETILPVSPFTTRGSEAPQNTVIRVLHEESDVWGGTKG
jgi:hypothetical protein